MAVERIQAPTGGTDVHTPAASLRKDRARLLANLLVHRPGKAILRGPFKGLNATGVAPLWSTTESLAKIGTMVLGYNILFQRTKSGPTLEWAMYDSSADTVTAVASSANLTAAGSSTVLGDAAYATTAQVGVGGIIKWSGTAVAPTAVTTGPVQALAVATHLRRLFVGGGSVPGTTTPNVPNALYWTDLEGPRTAAKSVTGVAATDIFTSTAHGYNNGDRVQFTAITGGAGLVVGTVYYVIAAAANTFQVSATPGGAAVNFTTDLTAGMITSGVMDWQDNTSGLTNQILVGPDREAITALASLGRQLLIFKEKSIWTLLGDTPSSFTLRQVSGVFGPGSWHGVCVRDGACFFIDSIGRLLSFDGANFNMLGDHTPSSLVLQNCRIVSLPNDYLLIGGSTQINPRPESWLFHIPTEAWISLSTDSTVLAAVGTATPVTNEYGTAFITDGRSVWLANALTDESSLVADQKYNSTSGSPLYVAIPARWTSRLLRLSLPFARSKITRAMVDHKTASASGAVGWSVSLRDGAATLIGSAYSLVGGTTPLAGEYLHQADDRNAEADEVYVDVTLTHPTPTDAISVAELHDVWIEHTSGQKQSQF